MLSKCANPACSAKLRYLRDGKIFRVDVQATPNRSLEQRRPTDAAPRKPIAGDSPHIVVGHDVAGKPEYFWLCQPCSQEMTIALREHAVVIVPFAPKVAHAVAS